MKHKDGWRPSSTPEELLRSALVPSWLNLLHLVRRERRSGEREYGLLPYLVPRGRTALDVGANKGVWTAALIKLTDQVHAFEPNPKIFDELHRALSGRAHLHRVALSDKTGKAEFRVPLGRKGYSNQGGSLSTVKVGGNFGAVDVETKRLDDLDLKDVGFIKIDVEGFEEAVIDGGQVTLMRDRPNLVVEIEEAHTKRPIESMISHITRLGYNAYGLVNGALRRSELIDFDKHHRRCTSRKDYIFNFVFLPSVG
jgi:FkbM family methyltransferase